MPSLADNQLAFYQANSVPPNSTLAEAEKGYWGPKQSTHTPWQNFSRADVKLAGLDALVQGTGSIADLERQWLLQSIGLLPDTPASIGDLWQRVADVPATNALLAEAVVLLDPRKETQTSTKTALTNYGTLGAPGNAQFGSVGGADTNDPVWLPHNGEDYVYFPKGDNIYRTPHSPANNITTAIDIRVKVRRASWTVSTANDVVVGKDWSAKRSYLILRSSGAIYFTVSPDGSFANQINCIVSCAALPVDTPLWLRATWSAATAVSTVYWSLDGTAWTSLGSIACPIASIYTDPTTNLAVGNDDSGSSAWGEAVYAMDLRSAIDGPVVVRWRASEMSLMGGTSIQTGESWTCLRTTTTNAKAVLVNRPLAYFSTDDWLNITNNAQLQFGAGQAFSLVLAERNWGNQPGWNMYAGNRQWNSGSGWWFGTAVQGTRQLSIAVSDGTTFSGSDVVSPADGELAVITANRFADGTMTCGLNGPASSSGPVKVAGSVSPALDTRIGSTNGGALITNMEFYGFGLWRRTLTDEEARLITNYFSAASTPIDKLRAEALEWLDARTYSGTGTLINQGTLPGSSGDLQLGSAAGADTNDPTFLSYAGEPYAYLPGIAGEMISAPSSTSLDFVATVGIEIIVDYQPTGAWTVARRPVARWGVGTSTWYIADTGQSSFVWWDGTGVRTLQTVSFFNNTTNFPNGSRQKLRYRALLNSGGTAVFSVDQWVTGAWVARPSINGAVSSLVPSTSPITIGTDSGNAQVAGGEGKYYEVILKRGFDGPVVAHWKATEATQTSYTDEVGNPWTINRTLTGKHSALVTRSMFLLGTDDFMRMLTDVNELDFAADQDFTILTTFRTWPTQGTAVYMGKQTSPDVADGFSLVTNNDGNIYFTFSGPVIADVPAGTLKTAFGKRQGTTHTVGFGGGASVTSTRSALALSNSQPFAVGVRGILDQYFANMEFFGAAVWKRALTPAEIQVVSTYFS